MLTFTPALGAGTGATLAQHGNASGAVACTACHGPHGECNGAAGFVKANMPLGLGGTLADQQAWDVAYFMDAHERSQDPRYTGSIAETRSRYHDSSQSLYETAVDGRLLVRGTRPTK